MNWYQPNVTDPDVKEVLPLETMSCQYGALGKRFSHIDFGTDVFTNKCATIS